MKYTYSNFKYILDLTILIEKINSSDMMDKSIEYINWDENELNSDMGILSCYFTSELISDDKIKLDNIILNENIS